MASNPQDNDSSYGHIKELLQDAPMTWQPALLAHMIETALVNNIFVEGGLERFVADVARRWKEKQALDTNIYNAGQTRKESE